MKHYKIQKQRVFGTQRIKKLPILASLTWFDFAKILPTDCYSFDSYSVSRDDISTRC